MANPLCLLVLFLLSFFFFLPSSSETLYNIVSMGAKPNSKFDSTNAFMRAWTSVCNSSHPAIIYVPYGSFLVGSIVFKGPCKNIAIKFLIDGKIVARDGYNSRSSSGRWIVFDNVNGITISRGNLDGKGAPLWACKATNRNCPYSGATTLTFMNSKNIIIRHLTSINSELFHIVIYQCQGVRVIGVNILAPGLSPNTDGVHVQMSTDVAITDTTIRTGDDCISVGPGTSSLWIEKVFCGPGHGISIGSLGKGQGRKVEKVENVTVKNVVFSGTQNGLRIKTWGIPSFGYVKGVIFEHIVMQNVENPIIINQNYCPHNKDCPGQNSGIRISEVKYMDVKGSSATQVAVDFNCSPSNPCRQIRLQDINLTYQNRPSQSSCRHASGNASGLIVPPNCL